MVEMRLTGPEIWTRLMEELEAFFMLNARLGGEAIFSGFFARRVVSDREIKSAMAMAAVGLDSWRHTTVEGGLLKQSKI